MRKLQHQIALESAAPGSPTGTKPSLEGQTRGQAFMRLISDEAKDGMGSDMALVSQPGGSKTLQEDEEEDEERRVGSVPTPPTLRLLIESLQMTVSQKMELAGISSVKDSMKLLFECRGLLDKLLKDIPNHKHFEEAMGPSGSVQELFQSFRKAPIVLPTASYQRSESSHKMVPELRSRQIAPAPTRTDWATSNPIEDDGAMVANMTTSVPGATQQPRRQIRAPRQPSIALTRQGSTAALRLGQQMSMTGTGPLGGTLSSDGSFQMSQAHRDQQLLLRHLRKQTQMMTSETQTADTIANYVPETKMKEVQHKCDQLVNLVEEYEQLLQKLQAQLDAARGAMASRSTVVDYLRTTLHRECCQLRSQLAVSSATSTSNFRQQQSIVFDRTMGSVGTLAPSLGLTTSGPPNTEVAGLHSLLDTILLAVESEKVIGADGTLEDSGEAKLRKLREDTTNRMIKWKKDHNTMRLRFTLLLREKNKQLQAIRLSRDVLKTQSALASLVGQVREDYMLIRRDIRERLNGMKGFIVSFVNEVELAVQKVGNEAKDNLQLRAQHRVLHDALKTSTECFIPMMKIEYASGSHPWVYESRDPEPILSFLMKQHAVENVAAVRHEIDFLQVVYKHLQKFNYQLYQQPSPTKPVAGRMMEVVATRIMCDEECTTELWDSMRQILATERDSCGKMVRLNFTIQRFVLNRMLAEKVSRVIVGKTLDAEPSALSISQLPARHRLQRLDIQIADLKVRKRHLSEFRAAQAKKLWLMWADSQIDVFPPGKGPRITRDFQDVVVTTKVPATVSSGVGSIAPKISTPLTRR